MYSVRKTIALFVSALILSAPLVAQPTWVEVVPLPTPRAFPSVAVLGGEVYVMGGRSAAGVALDVVERYDPLSNSWSDVDPLRDARFNASATVFNGQILLTGGRDGSEQIDDVEVYDPIEQRWESFDHLQDEREGHGVFTVGGDVYVFGGLDEALQYRDDAEVYNEGTSNWDDYGFWVLDQPRAAFGAIPVGADGVLIFGGFGPLGPVAEVEHYVPNQAGTLRASMPTPRGSLAAARVGELVFAIGGRDAEGDIIARVDAYNPNLNEWDMWPDLPDPREGSVAAGVGDAVYVFGGQMDTGALISSSLMLSTSTAIDPTSPERTFALAQTGPNPFVVATTISVTTEIPGVLVIAVYDMLGRRVATLHDGQLAAGRTEFVWSGTDDGGRTLPAGVYVVFATDGRQTAAREITRLR